MDKIKKYQTALIGLLNEYAEFLAGSAPVKPQVFIDKENNHFQLLKIGWDTEKQHFVFSVLFHFDIIDDKIWLQLNNTEFPIVDELIEHGIAKSDIVLGFQPPILRRKHRNVTAELV
jgi:hypothetical protein